MSILLSEMAYVESNLLSDSLSELDRILGALSSRLNFPTSVYEPDGKLVFATASLLQEIPETFISEYLKHRSAKSQSSEFGEKVVKASKEQVTDLMTLETIAGVKTAFKVTCSTSMSGMVVCTWSRVLVPVT